MTMTTLVAVTTVKVVRKATVVVLWVKEVSDLTPGLFEQTFIPVIAAAAITHGVAVATATATATATAIITVDFRGSSLVYHPCVHRAHLLHFAHEV